MAKLPRTSSKDINKIIKAAYKEDWRIEDRSGGHIMCFSPDKKTIVTINKTKKASRRIINDVRSDFRKGGLKV